MRQIYFLALLIGSIFVTFSCDDGPPVEEDYLSEEELNVDLETTYDVELIYSDSAVVSVMLTAPKMLTKSVRGDNRQIFPEGISVDFFGPSGRVQSELTCKKATRFEKDKTIVMEENVIWRSRAGETLDTEHLVWDEGDQKLRTKRLVKITTAQDVINGYGFEADQGFTKWQILRPQGEMGVESLE